MDFKTEFNNFLVKLKVLPQTVKTMPQEDLIYYGAIIFGVSFILIGVLLY